MSFLLRPSGSLASVAECAVRCDLLHPSGLSATATCVHFPFGCAFLLKRFAAPSVFSQDCQAYAAWLRGRTRDCVAVDEHGGQEFVQCFRADVELDEGCAKLLQVTALRRPSPSGLLRLYATCCGVPLFCLYGLYGSSDSLHRISAYASRRCLRCAPRLNVRALWARLLRA